jgi:nucleotide-binding universal stress UspA family protein
MTSDELQQFEQAVGRATAFQDHRHARGHYRQILLAYDGSADARAALERVAAVAAADSDVTVLTVIPYEAIGAKLDPIESSDRAWQWQCLVEATARLREHGIEPFIEAAAGNPAPVISDTARSLKADLVILGNGHGGRWHPSVRRNPVRRAVQRSVQCDTLVVRAPAEHPARDTSAQPRQQRAEHSHDLAWDRRRARPSLTHRTPAS